MVKHSVGKGQRIRKLRIALGMALVGIVAACGQSGDSAEEDLEGIASGDGDDDFVVDSSGDGDGDGESDLKPSIEPCPQAGSGRIGAPSWALVYDDFDDGDAFVNGLGVWYEYGDMTSTQSPSWESGDGWEPEPGGLTDDGYALHAVGEGFVEWGSGQGTIPGMFPDTEEECLFDVSEYDGISFWVRGSVVDDEQAAGLEDSGMLKFGMVEAGVTPPENGGSCDLNQGQCWDWHKVRILPDECWRRYSYRFDELEQDGWGYDAGDLDLDEIINFNFEVARGHSYDLWIDQLEFFVGDKPEEEERCSMGAGGAGGAGG